MAGRRLVGASLSVEATDVKCLLVSLKNDLPLNRKLLLTSTSFLTKRAQLKDFLESEPMRVLQASALGFCAAILLEAH